MDRTRTLADARRGLPDAVFVMMNPGSSRPLEESATSGVHVGLAAKKPLVLS